MGTHVIGMDGCRAGWVICRLKVETLSIDLIAVARSLSDVLGRESTATHIGIDIPIGLPEMGSSRPCDLEARERLTKLRSNSVFPAPARDLIRNKTYLEACTHSQAVCGKGVSKQAHAIFPKVAEVDDIMTPELQQRVFEVHPELCFWGLAGERPMQNSKKYPKGYKERRNLLAALLSTELPERARNKARIAHRA